MSEKLYYTAPPRAAFQDMKAACISLWCTYDDTFGYVSEKLSRIQDLENVSDNFMMMLAMFDPKNQDKIIASISPATKAEVIARLL